MGSFIQFLPLTKRKHYIDTYFLDNKANKDFLNGMIMYEDLLGESACVNIHIREIGVNVRGERLDFKSIHNPFLQEL